VHRCASPAAIARALRGDLDTILAKALQIDPARRYGTAAAFADDLRRHLARQPIQARADSRWYVAQRFVTRHRVAVAAAPLAVVGLTTTTAIAIWQARLATAQAARAEKASARAAAAQQFFAGLFASADPEQNKNVTDLDRKMIDRAFATAEAQFGGDPETLALILKQIAAIYDRLGLPAQLLAVQKRRGELADQSSNGLDIATRIEALADLGAALGYSKLPEERALALSTLERAAGMVADNGFVNSDQRVRAIGLLADELRALGRLDEAATQADEALQVAQRLPSSHPRRAFAHEMVAVTSRLRGDFSRARQHFAAALKIDETGNGRGKAAQVSLLSAWAQMEYEQANYSEALERAEQTLALASRDLGDLGATLMTVKLLSVAAAERMGDLAAARAAQSRNFASDYASADAFRIGRARYSDGWLLLAEGRPAQALVLFEQAAPGLVGSPHWTALVETAEATAIAQGGAVNAGTGERARNDFVSALPHAEAGYRYFLQLGARSREAARAGERLAWIQTRLGRWDEAAETLRSGCAWVEQSLDRRHPDRLRCAAYRALTSAGSDPVAAGEAQAQLLDAQRLLNSTGHDRMALVGQLSDAIEWLRNSPPANTRPMPFLY